MDYDATWSDGERGGTIAVRWGSDREDSDGLFAATVDGVERWIDEEEDLLGLVPDGARVTVTRGGVTLTFWRDAGALRVRASADRRDGPVTDGFERALVALGELDEARTAPRRCFWCTHSDYEPSTGFGGGHLACFVSCAERYHAAATSPDHWTRKWAMWGWDFGYRWVDELDTCPAWARRPRKHGYRG